jgi:predicted Zn-dependent protease
VNQFNHSNINMARVTRSSARAAASGKTVEQPVKAAPAITKKKLAKKVTAEPKKEAKITKAKVTKKVPATDAKKEVEAVEEKEAKAEEAAKVVSVVACKS